MYTSQFHEYVYSRLADVLDLLSLINVRFSRFQRVLDNIVPSLICSRRDRRNIVLEEPR